VRGPEERRRNGADERNRLAVLINEKGILCSSVRSMMRTNAHSISISFPRSVGCSADES
jgi:hypothetical protein